MGRWEAGSRALASTECVDLAGQQVADRDGTFNSCFPTSTAAGRAVPVDRICIPPLLLAEPFRTGALAGPPYTCVAATKEPRLPLACGLEEVLSDSLPRVAAVVFPTTPPFVRTPLFISRPVYGLFFEDDAKKRSVTVRKLFFPGGVLRSPLSADNDTSGPYHPPPACVFPTVIFKATSGGTRYCIRHGYTSRLGQRLLAKHQTDSQELVTLY